MRARKALPLDQMDLMSELGHSGCEGAAGRPRTDDADSAMEPFRGRPAVAPCVSGSDESRR